MNNKHIPWIEKYRPKNFESIVLSEHNKTILENIINMDIFPNLMLYGPPGTGKTTTIINLIQKYQEKHNENHKELKIHLNASDERGIDIIRNQIYNFVDSKSLFLKGTKFIILDEVDYMTKNAQQALKYLLLKYPENVKFCLICNYISKIDNMLRNEFFCLRFHHLPSNNIKFFIRNICENENISIKEEIVNNIIEHFQSDLRSMINYIQLNYNNFQDIMIINSNLFDEFINVTKTKKLNDVKIKLYSNCQEYNISEKSFIKNFIDYLLKNKKIKNIKEFLIFLEEILHVKYSQYILDYFLFNIKSFVS